MQTNQTRSILYLRLHNPAHTRHALLLLGGTCRRRVAVLDDVGVHRSLGGENPARPEVGVHHDSEPEGESIKRSPVYLVRGEVSRVSLGQFDDTEERTDEEHNAGEAEGCEEGLPSFPRPEELVLSPGVS